MARPKRTAGPTQRLTAKELKFLELMESPAIIERALKNKRLIATEIMLELGAKTVKAASDKGGKMMNRPPVAAVIEERKGIKLEAEKVRAVAAAKEEGKRQGLARAEHFELLAEIARNKRAVPTARVKAIVASAELKGMMIHKTANLSNEFQGRTPDEFDFFAEHGYWPEAAKPVESGDAGAATPPGAGPVPGKASKP